MPLLRMISAAFLLSLSTLVAGLARAEPDQKVLSPGQVFFHKTDLRADQSIPQGSLTRHLEGGVWLAPGSACALIVGDVLSIDGYSPEGFSHGNLSHQLRPTLILLPKLTCEGTAEKVIEVRALKKDLAAYSLPKNTEVVRVQYLGGATWIRGDGTDISALDCGLCDPGVLYPILTGPLEQSGLLARQLVAELDAQASNRQRSEAPLGLLFQSLRGEIQGLSATLGVVAGDLRRADLGELRPPVERLLREAQGEAKRAATQLETSQERFRRGLKEESFASATRTKGALDSTAAIVKDLNAIVTRDDMQWGALIALIR